MFLLLTLLFDQLSYHPLLFPTVLGLFRVLRIIPVMVLYLFSVIHVILFMVLYLFSAPRVTLVTVLN